MVGRAEVKGVRSAWGFVEGEECPKTSEVREGCQRREDLGRVSREVRILEGHIGPRGSVTPWRATS